MKLGINNMNEIDNLKDKLIEQLQLNNDLLIRIRKTIEYINYMFDKANENDIIDDLLKIEKILEGE